MKGKHLLSSIAGAVLLASPLLVMGMAHASSSGSAPSVVYVSATMGSDSVGTGTQSSPYATISNAIANVATGGTVIVEPGTYMGMVTVTKPLTLESDPSAPNAAANTIIDGAGQDHAVMIASSNVTVEGLTIENANKEGLMAAGKGALTNLVIRDNVVTNNALGPIPANTDYEALHLMGVEDSTIVDNQVIGNMDGGLYLTDETAPNFGNVVSGNTVSNNKVDCGITLASHVGGHGVYDNTITNNTSEGNGAAGILMATPVPGGMASFNTVSNNKVENNAHGGIVLHTHAPGSSVIGNTITHNVIMGNGPDNGVVTTVSTGISVGASGSPIAQTVIANNIIANETDGISVQDMMGHQYTLLAGNWMNKNNVTHKVVWVPMPAASARPQG